MPVVREQHVRTSVRPPAPLTPFLPDPGILVLMTDITTSHAPLSSSTVSAGAEVQERDRARVPDKYKWNLTDLYASKEDWRLAKERLVSETPEVGRFRGTLGQSAATLADALELVTRLN